MNRRKKLGESVTFWSRVWKGDNHALHCLSLTVFIGVLGYVVFPYFYQFILDKLVIDILQQISLK